MPSVCNKLEEYRHRRAKICKKETKTQYLTNGTLTINYYLPLFYSYYKQAIVNYQSNTPLINVHVLPVVTELVFSECPWQPSAIKASCSRGYETGMMFKNIYLTNVKINL